MSTKCISPGYVQVQIKNKQNVQEGFKKKERMGGGKVLPKNGAEKTCCAGEKEKCVSIIMGRVKGGGLHSDVPPGPSPSRLRTYVQLLVQCR